jgi:hypothetical protein
MKILLLMITMFISSSAMAGAWISISPSEIENIELWQSNTNSTVNEGVYFRHKSQFSSSESCSNKSFIVVTDPKLADRALSVAIFAISTNKSIKLWVAGCDNAYLHATAVMIIP